VSPFVAMVIYSYSTKAFKHWWLWWCPILAAENYGDWPPSLASDINGDLCSDLTMRHTWWKLSCQL